ncbi:MAG: AEC family transporter [Massiliimalia sp.]
MSVVLWKAASFVLVIIIGYVLKQLHIFKVSDFQIVSRIIMKITLPSVIITTFNGIKFESQLLLIVAFGIVCNLITIGVGWILARKMSPSEKAFHMINMSGYNIGCFTFPFIQSMMEPIGTITCCLFDTGNSLLCTGGTYGIAASVANNGERNTFFSFLKKCISSVPLDVYLIMLTLSICHFSLPDTVISLMQPMKEANGFLAMLMIGIGFELFLESTQIKQIIKILGIRYGISVLCALLFWFLLPFSESVRLALVIVLFSPISVVAPIFTQKCQGNVEMSSALNSLSIIISLISITSILLVAKV